MSRKQVDKAVRYYRETLHMDANQLKTVLDMNAAHTFPTDKYGDSGCFNMCGCVFYEMRDFSIDVTCL